MEPISPVFQDAARRLWLQAAQVALHEAARLTGRDVVLVHEYGASTALEYATEGATFAEQQSLFEATRALDVLPLEAIPDAVLDAIQPLAGSDRHYLLVQLDRAAPDAPALVTAAFYLPEEEIACPAHHGTEPDARQGCRACEVLDAADLAWTCWETSPASTFDELFVDVRNHADVWRAAIHAEVAARIDEARTVRDSGKAPSLVLTLSPGQEAALPHTVLAAVKEALAETAGVSCVEIVFFEEPPVDEKRLLAHEEAALATENTDRRAALVDAVRAFLAENPDVERVEVVSEYHETDHDHGGTNGWEELHARICFASGIVYFRENVDDPRGGENAHAATPEALATYDALVDAWGKTSPRFDALTMFEESLPRRAGAVPVDRTLVVTRTTVTVV